MTPRMIRTIPQGLWMAAGSLALSIFGTPALLLQSVGHHGASEWPIFLAIMFFIMLEELLWIEGVFRATPEFYENRNRLNRRAVRGTALIGGFVALLLVVWAGAVSPIWHTPLLDIYRWNAVGTVLFVAAIISRVAGLAFMSLWLMTLGRAAKRPGLYLHAILAGLYIIAAGIFFLLPISTHVASHSAPSNQPIPLAAVLLLLSLSWGGILLIHAALSIGSVHRAT